MNPTLEAAYIGGGTALLAAIIVGVLTYLKRENNSQSTRARGNGQAISSSGSGNAVNAGGNVHIGDIVAPAAVAPIEAVPGANVYHNPKPGYSTKPTPQEITLNIKNHPPLQRDDIRKHYIGLLVHWRLQLNTTHILQNDAVSVNLYALDPFCSVSCQVSLTRFPRLKIIGEDATIWAFGEIENFEPQIIYLKNATIDFDDQ